MKYLLNTWYLAGWDYEISREMIARQILDKHVLLFRKEDGSAVAMSNLCPHRFAPLHKGKLIGDTVECPYHGLQFDCAGQCTYNPHPHGNGQIPPRAQLDHYPLVERYGGIWIWMGEKEPDESLLPDYHYISDTEHYRTVRGVFDINNNYQMVADNALDLTHVTYLHAERLASGAQNVANEKRSLEQDGTTIWCKRFNYSIDAGADFKKFNPALQDIKVDKQQNVRWSPPANIVIVIDYSAAGEPDLHRTTVHAGNILTPISETETRMFWSVSRNFGLNVEMLDHAMTESAKVALIEQDKQMIESQLKYMGTTDIESCNPVYIADDITPIKARKVLKRLIDEEELSAADAASSG